MIASYLIMFFVFGGLVNGNDKEKCNVCLKIVDNFNLGLKKTSKSNFGGGNTKWEQERLGSYASSETRFLEIMDGICSGQNKECHLMIEKYEEDIEKWWKKMVSSSIGPTSFREFLCVKKTNFCCPSGTFGQSCRECKGGRNNVCSGNGKCIGDGTKEGTGECACDVGYDGDVCSMCMKGYYPKKSAHGQLLCSSCHQSCKGSCSGPSHRNCVACKDGWVMMGTSGCSDVNECEDETMCKDNQYCFNTDGSYKCLECHSSCSKCSGGSPFNCSSCAPKFFRDSFSQLCQACHSSCASRCEDATQFTCDSCVKGWVRKEREKRWSCEDVDECEEATKSGKSICQKDEYCINIPGSSKCSTCHPSCASCHGPGNEKCNQCKQGFHLEGQACTDIDECLHSSKTCPDPNSSCVNTMGSFRCQCSQDHVFISNRCLSKQEAKELSKNQKTTSKPPSFKRGSQPPNRGTFSKRTSKKSFFQSELFQYFASIVLFILFLLIFPVKNIFFQIFVIILFSVYMYYFAEYLDVLSKNKT